MGTVQLISTKAGTHFARRIGKELNAIGHHYYLSNIMNCDAVFMAKERDDYMIHPRVAYPFPQYSKFMTFLFAVSSRIFVSNSPFTLALTSNKYKCNEHLEKSNIKVPHAILLEDSGLDFYRKNFKEGLFIIKPIVSNGGGKTVHLFRANDDYNNYVEGFLQNGGKKKCFAQLFINVDFLYRVILVNGIPYKYVFVDYPELEDGNWKLSVCINKNMECTVLDNISQDIVDIAIKAQQAVNGHINFVDVFENSDGDYFISEINTSCNLRLHEKISDSNIAEFIAEGLVNSAGW